MGRTKSGTTTATPKRLGISRRTARATPPESMALATMEPSTQAATLSGWPSMRAASSRIRSGFQPSPRRWSAITTPAVSAAALDPRPLPIGIWLSMIEIDRRELAAGVPGHRQRRLPDQVVLARRDLVRVAARPPGWRGGRLARKRHSR